MNETAIANDTELQRVLWAFHDYWSQIQVPPEQRAVCYTWIARPFKDKFGVNFHQSRLQALADLGFLTPDESLRGGNRRYYRVKNPEQVAELLGRYGLLL